ncbi:uncharacterized protein LOC119665561 [Teleopsis dalmanni]|uniref:uncharacterized protein LOC119665561 n=1 Tax=Teleopsis dalmanni TaxID=139649 RepID=UPI0018CE606D|nr:uncharacterized protein LOC119665561 [Teleopsis dalmanni]
MDRIIDYGSSKSQHTHMKAKGLMKNIEGIVPASNTEEKFKELYERNEGRPMNAIIQPLDVERSNFVLTCTTLKEMMDKLSNIYEKNSEIRFKTLYEEYFSLKMKDDETVTGYVAKVNQLASEIEQQGEKLSDKLKVVHIISSLSVRFNHYKTTWYNTYDTRKMNTLMSSLRLEEESLNRISGEKASSVDVAFNVKIQLKKVASKLSLSKIDILKKKTKYNGKCSKNKDKNELTWCTVEYSDENESNSWYADSGASSHMTFHHEWFTELRKDNGGNMVKAANN